jgi:hypothetical protein
MINILKLVRLFGALHYEAINKSYRESMGLCGFIVLVFVIYACFVFLISRGPSK